jgi:hypothetical protein
VSAQTRIQFRAGLVLIAAFVLAAAVDWLSVRGAIIGVAVSVPLWIALMDWDAE